MERNSNDAICRTYGVIKYASLQNCSSAGFASPCSLRSPSPTCHQCYLALPGAMPRLSVILDFCTSRQVLQCLRPSPTLTNRPERFPLFVKLEFLYTSITFSKSFISSLTLPAGQQDFIVLPGGLPPCVCGHRLSLHLTSILNYLLCSSTYVYNLTS
jgi:hypothetical protein